MKSKIAEAIRLKSSPIAVIWTDKEPQEEGFYPKGKLGCIGPILVSASKGHTLYLDGDNIGCPGGKSSLGFGAEEHAHEFPGGIEYFLSSGYKELYKTEEGRKLAAEMPVLAEGEGYYKNPEVTKKIIRSLPSKKVDAKYVVFKPLEKVEEEEKPKIVVFLAYPDQLSALLVLANYEGENNQNVISPMGAGCSSIGMIPYHEEESNTPRAVLGLFDISVRKHFDKNILSFAVPYKLFRQMEGNVEGSFLGKEDWLKIAERI